MNSSDLTRIKLILALFLTLSSLLSVAQETMTVTGSVIDAETRLPIPYVNVFFNNTTLGAATDSLGRYRINGVPAELKEIVASSVGYTTLKATLNLELHKDPIIDFKMIKNIKVLSDVVIYANREINGKKWNRQYNQFKKIFLGQTSNAASVEILNPYEVYFKEGKENDDFTAHADQPLQIENRAIGYKLYITLDEFSASENDYKMLITTRFDPLTPKNSKERERWQQNRINTYKGSPRHLFKSIMDGRYEEEGFRIYKGGFSSDFSGNMIIAPRELPVLISDIYVDTTKSNFKIFKKGLYQINYLNAFVPKKHRSFAEYTYPISWIDVVDSFLTLAPNGEPIHPSYFTRIGFMNSFRVADMLPYNFEPVQEESSLALLKQMELSSIRGTVIDEHHNPLSEVEVFINNGLTHTTTNRWGQFEIPNLSSGRYPIGFAYSPLAKELRIVDVSGGEDVEITVQLNERSDHTFILERDDYWEGYKTLFRQKLQQQIKLPGLSTIVNPYVLRFKASKKKILVKLNAPLIIENRAIGYEWKCFTDSAVLLKKRGVYRLQMTGLIKMDTLPSISKRESNKWQSNRIDEYKGSWNNFSASLIEGRVEDEGFKTYLLKKPSQRRVKFKKLTSEDIVRIKPDSLLVIQKQRYTLAIPKGLEIHYADKSGDQKFYRGFSKQVIRINSDSSRVPISVNGVMAPEDIHISGIKDEFLKGVPIDFKPSKQKITNPEVLAFVKEANLKLIRKLLEKTYVQTDRPYYYAGDTIWMKAYMKYANMTYKDSLSKVLYVELVNPKNNVISNRILKIKEGQAWGDFVLPFDAEAGDYYLRAYTDWMRNFNEFFVCPLPLISRQDFIVSQNIDPQMAQENPDISLTSNKENYQARESVELALHISNNQNPGISSFSVSVTDQSAVSELNGISTIRSLKNSFKADGSKIIRLKYQVENGVTLNGKIRHASYDGTYLIAAALTQNKGTVITKVMGSEFQVTLDFTDTLSAIIQCTDNQGSYLNTEIYEKDSVGFFIPPAPLAYQLYNNTSYTQTPLYLDKTTRVLEDVFIRAKRISTEEHQLTSMIHSRYGFAHRVIEGQEILALRKNDWINTLNNLLYDALPASLQQNFDNPEAYNISTHSISKPRLINKIYRFYLNGQLQFDNSILNIPASTISRIEVYKYPFNIDDVVSIYTEPQLALNYQNFDKYKLRGYSVPLSYRIPDARSKGPDYRPTIYWNPLIKTDENGKAIISFRTSDVDGTYKVTIEGVTENGEFFRKVKLLTITK